MKRNSKLLAFIIALAMLMTMVVIPVSAGTTNIAGTITGVTEDGAPTYTGMVKASDGAAEPSYINYNGNATLTYNEGVLSVTNRTYNNCLTGIQIGDLGVQSGKTYFFSAEFRRDSEVWCNNGKDENGDGEYDYTDAAGSTASDTKVQDNIKVNLYPIKVNGSKVDVDTTYTTGTTLLSNFAVTLTNQNEWYPVSTLFTTGVNASGTDELGMNLGFKVGRNSNSNTFDYSVRNIVIYEVDETLTATAAAGVENNTAVFTFNNPVDAETAVTANFEVDKGSNATPSYAVETEGNICTVKLTGFTPGAQYTVTAKSGKVADIFGNTLSEDAVATITTVAGAAGSGIPSGVDILSAYGFDGTFESGTVGSAAAGLSISGHPYVDSLTQSGGAPSGGKITADAANNGTQSLAIANTASSSNNTSRITYVPVDAGAMYKITSYIKLQAAPAEDTTVKAWYQPGSCGNDSVKVTNSKKEVEISADKFVEVTGYFTTAYNKAEKFSHIHLPVYTNTGAAIYVDDWTVTEIPALTATTAVEGNTATFTFSNDLGTVAESNITVSPETASISVSKSGKVVTVTLSDYDYEETYTITTNGIKDTYGQTLASEVSASITTEAEPVLAPVSSNLAVSKSFGAKNSYTVAAENDITTVTPPETITSGFAAQMDNAIGSAYAGKVYVASAWVNSNGTPDGKTRVRMALTYGGDAQKVLDKNASAKYNTVRLDGTWQRISCVVSPVALSEIAEENKTLIDKAAMHLGITVEKDNDVYGTDSFLIKDVQVREAVALDLDSAYKAVVFTDAHSGNTTLHISGGTDTIYFIATSSDGEIHFGKGTPAAADEAAIIDLGLTSGKEYRLFMWTSGMKPLQSVFTTADLK